MAQGTVTPIAAVREPVSLPFRTRMGDRMGDTMRWLAREDVVGGVDCVGTEAVGLLLHDLDVRESGSRAILIEIAYETARLIAQAWRYRRALRATDRPALRILGRLVAEAKLEGRDVEETVTNVYEVLIGAMTDHAQDATIRWRQGLVDEVVDELAQEARTVGDEVVDVIRAGFLGAVETGPTSSSTSGWLRVLLGALEGGLAGPELGVAASEVYLDVSVPYQVVLLVHPNDDTSVLDAAAQAAESEIARCVDLGLGDRLPLHRRLVIEALTPGVALAARTAIEVLGRQQGVMAIAPPPAPRLADIAAQYAETVEQLPATLDAAKGMLGCIDPTCFTEPLADPAGEPPDTAA